MGMSGLRHQRDAVRVFVLVLRSGRPALEVHADGGRKLVLPDHVVAFARAFLEAGSIEELDIAAAVSDEAACLQRLCQQGHGGAPDADHLGEVFLGQRQPVAADTVGGLQEPAAQPRGGAMGGVARRELLLARELMLNSDGMLEQRWSAWTMSVQDHVGTELFSFALSDSANGDPT